MYPSSRPADFEAHLRKVKVMLNEPGRLRASRLLFSNSYKDWDTRVAQVKTPVLILNGSHDPDFKEPERQHPTPKGGGLSLTLRGTLRLRSRDVRPID